MPHDALDDVEATLCLCKLLSERVPDLWSSFLRFTQKAAVVDHVNGEEVFCLTDFYGAVPHAWLVTALGPSTSRKSDILVFDLAADPDELLELPEDELVVRLAQTPRIVRRLRTNACPIIVPRDMAPDITAAKTLSDAELDRRALSLRSESDYCRRLISAFEQGVDERNPWPHVEQQIYDAFISDADETVLTTFHAAPWEERLSLLESLEDMRLKHLGRRLIFLERPDVLPDGVRQKMTVGLAKRLIDGDGAGTWLCLERAIQEADDLISLAAAGQQAFLREHRSYLANKLVELSVQLA
jgi:exodeoxyribonuclease-1